MLVGRYRPPNQLQVRDEQVLCRWAKVSQIMLMNTACWCRCWPERVNDGHVKVHCTHAGDHEHGSLHGVRRQHVVLLVALACLITRRGQCRPLLHAALGLQLRVDVDQHLAVVEEPTPIGAIMSESRPARPSPGPERKGPLATAIFSIGGVPCSRE